MALQFRRVVTGHDATGRAIVKFDEIGKNLVSSRPVSFRHGLGQQRCFRVALSPTLMVLPVPSG